MNINEILTMREKHGKTIECKGVTRHKLHFGHMKFHGFNGKPLCDVKE